MTVVESPDGLRLRGGLVALTAETIRPGRVQAVRMVEPLLWRPFGWCRLEVDVAGTQKREGEGAVEGKRLRAVLPVGSRALALDLVARILPGTPTERLRPPPPREVEEPAALPQPLMGPQRRLRRDDERPHPARDAWVPLEKVQSLRRVEGPLQRRLQLATIHVDTAGRNVHASLRDRDRAEADGAFAELVGLARAARAQLARDRRSGRRRRRRAARPTASRSPTPSLAPSTSAERPTPHRHSVATSGETTVTGPWKYASKRQR